MKVLIVDSDNGTMKALETAYAIRGFIVLTAQTAVDGLNKLIDPTRPKKPDLVIVDPMNTGMNGVDIIRRIRAINSLASTPLIVVSADEDLIDNAIVAGATSGLSKPVSVEAITKLSKRLLDERQATMSERSSIGYMTGSMSF